MRNLIGLAALTASLLLGSAGFAAPAEAAPSGVKVGVLTCHVSSGWGFVFGSSKDLHCNYAPRHRRADHYVGTISRFGVDVGYSDSSILVWDVIAPTSDIRAGALEGNYIGATATAAVGPGLGANVLVGGLDKSIALQPISVQGYSGLNVAAGIGEVNLKAVH